VDEGELATPSGKSTSPASLPVPLKNVGVSALAVRKKVPNPRENPVSFAIIYAGGNFESLTLYQITRDG